MYRILVVEDDEVIAKTIRQHLQSWNYEVFAVADFNSVMEEFARVKPHLVLMDIRLPLHRDPESFEAANHICLFDE